MPRRFAYLLLASAFLLVAAPSIAHANCANPTGVKGEFFYNDDFAIMQFCDGTDWIGMSGGATGGAGVTDGDKGDITVSGSGASWLIDDDLLDFTEFKEALSLDASTDIAISGSLVFSLTNTGTADSFVVNDQTTDTTPFVIDAAGNVGIGLAVPTQALDVVGKTTSDSFIVKPQTGLAAPTGGSSPSAQWSTDGSHVWRATGNVGIGTNNPTREDALSKLTVVGDGSYGQITAVSYNPTGTGGTDNASVFKLLGARGSVASPSALGTADRFGLILANGHDGANFMGSASIEFRTNGAIAASSVPSKIDFHTTAVGATSRTQRMTILSNGNVGIGTTGPIVGLHVNQSAANTDGRVRISGTGDTNAAGLELLNNDSTKKWDITTRASSNDDLWFSGYNGSTWTTAMVLGQDGGTYLQGEVYFSALPTLSASGSDWYVCRQDGTGRGFLNGTSCRPSDARLKKDIETLAGALAKVGRLRGVSFYWRKDSRNQGEQLGVIAQEVETVYPQAVVTNSDGFKAVDHTALIGPVIEAIKELKSLFDTDHDEIAALKADNDNLRAEHGAEIKALRAEIEALKAAR